MLKMFSKGKKMIVLSAMVLLLILTAVLNIALNNQSVDTGTGAVTASAGFFANFRSDREIAREREMIVINALLNDPATTPQGRQKAEEDKLRIARNIALETVAEGRIKALGFNDAIITTGNNFYHVVVNSDGITAAQATQIAEIVATEASTRLDNVVVSYLA